MKRSGVKTPLNSNLRSKYQLVSISLVRDSAGGLNSLVSPPYVLKLIVLLVLPAFGRYPFLVVELNYLVSKYLRKP